ncbi:hypothetical protein GTN66_07610 [bacterium]|nr:hypothetical protein [bacterium]NIN93332.1 hypothetical protein [bacterium]NIO19127.1 hypothetical protein [bacterium]NIO74258.1 hypothetical protein [bacterium]
MVHKFIRRWKGMAIAGLVVFLFISAALGAEKKEGDLDTITVTRVKVEPLENEKGAVGVAKAMLNECIVVREIKVMKVNDKTVLKFPEYISSKGIVYPQIKFLTEEARKAVIEAVETGEPSKNKVKQVSFKVTDWYRLKGTGKRKVNAEVTFNNAVAVSCGIMEGKRGPWVAWPARPPEKHKRQWIKQIYIYDKEIKKAVERLLLTKYEAMLQEEEW